MTAQKTTGIQESRSVECFYPVIEVIPNGIVVIDEDGLIVLVNGQAETIFGYRRDELLGQSVELLIPERFRRTHPYLRAHYFANLVCRMIGEGRELQGRRHDGSEFPVDIGLAPLRITEGLFVLAEIVDITARKQKEASILRTKEIEARESERRHLARELHDELGQLLSTIGVDLRTTKVACGSAAPHLDDSIALVDQAIEQVRSLSLDLRPAMLDDLGLIATLRWYAERQAQRAGLVLHFDTVSSGARLPTDLATACYRIVQEALTNVIRHARARQVWIEFRETQGDVRLTVRDDGIGFDPASIRQGNTGQASFGVLGMQERVELQGGKFEIQSHPAQGTTVEVSIPQSVADSS